MPRHNPLPNPAALTEGSNEMAQTNKQWMLDIPALTGIAPLDPTRGARLPTGAYRVMIMDSEQRTNDEGKVSLSFTVEVTEGEHKGSRTWVTQGVDFSKEGNKKSWVGLLLSIGAPRATIDNPGGLKLNPGSFLNRPGYIYVKAAPEGEKDAFDNRNFITPEQYATLAAQQQAAAPQVGSAVGHAAPQPVVGGQPAAFGAPVPTNGALGQLGAAIGTPTPAPAGGLTFP